MRATGATWQWAVDDPAEVTALASGLRLRQEWTFADSPDVARLP